MPELPDVETSKRYLASTSLHKKIDEIVTCSNDM